MLRFNQKLLIGCLLPLALLWNCQTGGSELPNEVHGSLIGLNHKPVVDAKVSLYPVDYIPGDSTNKALPLSAQTDSAGNYAFKNVPQGQYNIVGSQDTLGFFRDSVSVTGEDVLGNDTLKVLGALSGIVQLQPQDDPRAAIVQVMGTDDYVNVNADGSFTLSALAEGTYRLRVAVSLPNYTPLFTDVTVRSGIHDTLPQPLIPFYTGIPVVTGLQASLDTARGIAKITWHPVTYSAFQSYLVYRDTADVVNLSQTPINKVRITDTVYFDTLYATPGDTLPHNWEYRIRIQNTSGTVGNPYQSVLLQAVPPQTVTTSVQMRVLGNHGDSASIKDTVRITAIYNNPTYANKKVIWFVSGSADTLRQQNLNAESGTDTLIWVTPDTAVTRTFSTHFLDAAGRQWTDSHQLLVVADPPVANAGRDTTVSIGQSFTLHGTATDVFGHIVKWEWDIGATGKFVLTTSGDTTFTLPSTANSNFLCILRVTDNYGLTGLDTLMLSIVSSRIIGTLKRDPASLVSFQAFPWQNKIIYATVDSSGNLVVAVFNPSNGNDSVLSVYPYLINPYCNSCFIPAVFGDTLYIMGAEQPHINKDSLVATYNLLTAVWGTAPAMPLKTSGGFGIVSGGKIYVISQDSPGQQILEFDPVIGIWSDKNSLTPISGGEMLSLPAISADSGKVYFVGGTFGVGLYSGTFAVYNPVLNIWSFLKDIPQLLSGSPYGGWSGLGTVWINGKLYGLGGDCCGNANGVSGNPDAKTVEEFDPEQNLWIPKAQILIHRSYFAITSIGGKIYLLGGTNSTGNLNSVEEYSP